MSRLRFAPLAAAICLLVLTFAGSARAAGPSPPAPTVGQASLLFTQAAARGTVKPTACRCRGRRILTLHGVARQLVWFSDRPARKSGQLKAGLFAREWAGFGFRVDAPNAALSLLDADHRSDTVVVELLSRPRYDRNRRSMRYVVRLLPEASGNLAGFEAGRDARVARRFGPASLFIDDVSAPVINGCVIAPGTSCPRANLRTANLSNANLAGANLFDADLTGANLTGANLAYARLDWANLLGANLSDADLTAAQAQGSYIATTNFDGANLSYADFTGAADGYLPDGQNVLDVAGPLCDTTLPSGKVDSNC